MDELRTILDYVIKEYIEEGDDRDVGETTPLITGGIVDSFSMVSLKRFLERKFSISIPDADARPQAFDKATAQAQARRKKDRWFREAADPGGAGQPRAAGGPRARPEGREHHGVLQAVQRPHVPRPGS